MEWIKSMWGKFQALPTWQKFGIVGLFVAAIVLLVKWQSGASSTSTTTSTVDPLAATSDQSVATVAPAATSDTASNAAASDTSSSINSLLGEYENQLQASQLAQQNAMASLTSEYQQLQSIQNPNPITIAATQGVARAIGNGVNSMVSGLFGNSTNAAITNTATPYFASNFTVNGSTIPAGVDPSTVLSAIDRANAAGGYATNFLTSAQTAADTVTTVADSSDLISNVADSENILSGGWF